MDLRPQAHEIIRTWLFSTVVRAHFEHGVVPWSNAAISGWILDPDRKKMSKSRGNVVTPIALLEQYGSDAVRYWAASARPGTDTAFDEGQMKIGRRLAIKILNASKFVLGFGDEATIDTARITAPLDRAVLARLADLVDETTRAFEGYDYARALERTEAFFWGFTDNHLELVKARAYGEHGDAESARHALRLSLSTLLRLFAPFLPFVTEEVWSWWRPGSVHRSTWPVPADVLAPVGGSADEAGEQSLAVAIDVLAAIRREKSESKRPLKAAISRAVVRDVPARLRALELVRRDVMAAGIIRHLEPAEGDAFGTALEFAEGTPASQESPS
jgi:valyl-tRNA synthetase